MALNPSTNPTMAGRVTAPSVDYPYGSSKDESAPGANDGTPYFLARANDIFGLQQALLTEAGIVPDGNADTAIDSQYFDAMWQLFRSGRKNYLINGTMDVWQRGISFLVLDGFKFSADRWETVVVSNDDRPDVSRVTLLANEAAVLPFKYYMRCKTPLSQSGYTQQQQKIEDIRNFDPNKTYTLSYYARSDQSSTVDVVLQQDYGTGGSGTALVSQTQQQLTTGFTRYTVQFSPVDYSGQGVINSDSYLRVAFRSTTAGELLDISGVQVEEGPQATDFEYRPIAEELALCQRYYESSSSTTFLASYATLTHSANCSAMVPFKVEKRAAPAVTLTGEQFLSGGAINQAGRFGFSYLATATDSVNIARFNTWAANAEL